MVSLEDAPSITLYGNLVGTAHTDLGVGLPLEAVFDDVTPDDSILRWRIAGSTPAEAAGGAGVPRE
jgi:hypothetical protein